MTVQLTRRAAMRASAALLSAAAALMLVSSPAAHAQTPVPPTATPQAKPDKRAPKTRVIDRLAIIEVTAGSPAEKAGLKAGDAITSIAGAAVTGQQDLASIVAARKPGDTLALEVLAADGAKRTVTVTLGDNPAKAGTAYLGVRYGTRGMRGAPGQGGHGFRFDSGPISVAEVQKDSPAAKAGVQVGDVIAEAKGAAVNDLTALKRVLAGAKPGDTLTLKVTRGGTSQTLSVTLGESASQKGMAYLGIAVTLPRIQVDPGQPASGTQG